MGQSRIDAFLAMAKDNPNDSMIWYGLATEYLKLEKLSEAIDALQNVIRINPDNTAAYQMLGSTLLTSGKVDEAREVWRTGVAIATRLNQFKPKQHMEGLLATTTPNNENGFCH